MMKISLSIVNCMNVELCFGCMNCGMNVRKNSVVFGFSILVGIVCRYVLSGVMGDICGSDGLDGFFSSVCMLR